MKNTDLLCSVLVCISLFCVACSCITSSNQYDAYDLTADGDRVSIRFMSSYYSIETVNINITEDEYRESMTSLGARENMLFKDIPDCFVREERAVRILADYIMALYPDDLRRARAACFLCQSAIEYTEDHVLYGCQEYWARPTETLYNLKGDCEDTAILFCSLCKCMGIPTVLLNGPNHVASAVCVITDAPYYFDVDGQRYYYAITSSSSVLPYDIGMATDNDMEVAERSSDFLYYMYSYYKLIGDKVIRWL